MADENLKDKTVKALGWSFVDKFGQQLINLVTGGIVLPRLLLQEDYGLVGMLAIFIALSNVLLDSGFGGALIKKKHTTQADFNAVFYFNVVVSLALYGLLYVCAPLIADFYDKPELTTLSRVLFLAILFNAFNFIQTIILTKELQFNRLAQYNFAALLLSSIIAVVMGLYGAGVWALVAQQLLLPLFKSILLWAFNRWRPSWGFSLQPLREVFAFSSRMLATGLINAVFNNIYTVIIGKAYNTVDTGNFVQAKRYQEIPVLLISNTFRTVALPMFASANTDNERLGRVLQKTNQSIAFVLFPVILGLYVIAESLVVGLVGNKWIDAVPFLRILLLSGLFSVFAQIFNELLTAKGKSRTILRIEILNKFVLIIALFCTFRQGIIGMVYGWVAYSFFTMFTLGYYVCRIISYPLIAFFRSVAPYFLLAVAMAVLTSLFGLIAMNDYLRMGIQIVFGALFYAGGCLLFRLEMSDEVTKLLQRITKRS